MIPPPRLAPGGRPHRRRHGQALHRVAVHLARDVFLAGRRGLPVQSHPHAQQRVGESIALAVALHQVDVLQPGEIVLRRAGVRCRRGEMSVSVSGSCSGEEGEDGLERAVAARAVQPQLVA